MASPQDLTGTWVLTTTDGAEGFLADSGMGAPETYASPAASARFAAAADPPAAN